MGFIVEPAIAALASIGTSATGAAAGATAATGGALATAAPTVLPGIAAATTPVAVTPAVTAPAAAAAASGAAGTGSFWGSGAAASLASTALSVGASAILGRPPKPGLGPKPPDLASLFSQQRNINAAPNLGGTYLTGGQPLGKPNTAGAKSLLGS